MLGSGVSVIGVSSASAWPNLGFSIPWYQFVDDSLLCAEQGIFSSEQGTFAGGTRNSLTQNSIMERPVMRDDRNSCGRGATRGADVVSRLVARAGAFWPREDQISIVGLFLF
jgi:hypothetical protein